MGPCSNSFNAASRNAGLVSRKPTWRRADASRTRLQISSLFRVIWAAVVQSDLPSSLGSIE
jgi:hypothetical protein